MHTILDFDKQEHAKQSETLEWVVDEKLAGYIRSHQPNKEMALAFAAAEKRMRAGPQ